MDMNLDLRIEQYLDGDMSPDEARQFESELATPAVARAYDEALLIRTLLKSRVEVPDGLSERIADAMLDEGRATAQQEADVPSAAGVILDSFQWALRGSTVAVTPGAPGNTVDGVRASFGAVRQMLPPVDAFRSEARKQERKRPLWRRLIRL